MSAAKTPLTDEARRDILERAVGLEARSLAHYLARCAPPQDSAKRPEALRILEAIAREEEDGAQDLARRIDEIGGTLAPIRGYDPGFTHFNYVTGAYALASVSRKMDAALAALDALAAEAGDDLWVAPALAAAKERRLRHRSLIEATRARIGTTAAKNSL